MKQVIIIIRKHLVLLLLLLCSLNLRAQNSPNDGSVNLGKIPVYKFKLDSLRYNDGITRLSAIGTEYMADLYSFSIGSNTYLKIVIDGESLVITDNPYGKNLFGRKVSPHNYYHAHIYKEGRYEEIPDLTHKAGSYLMALPFSYSDNVSSQRGTQNLSSATENRQKAEPQWQLLGKVTVYSNMRKEWDGSESDVVFDEETAFLYTSYSESTIKYRISIPKYGEQYDVHDNDSYTGAKVQYTRNGKRVQYMPNISEMFTHYAGKYYFDVDRVVQ